MDIINGIGAVIIFIVYIILAPIFWLVKNPIALVCALGAVASIIAFFSIRSHARNAAEEKRRAEEIAADPFKEADEEWLRFWESLREGEDDEEHWQWRRRNIAQQLESSIRYYEGERDFWSWDYNMRRHYEGKIAALRTELPLWQDGGLFDKPLTFRR